MKLKSLYSFLLATALVACNEDFNEGIAGYQTNDPEDAAATVSFSATPASETAIDLATVEGEKVKICSFTAPTLEEGTSVSYILTMKDDIGTSAKISVDKEGKVKVSDLQEVVETFYGKRPVPRTMKSILREYIVRNKQAAMGESAEMNIVVTVNSPVIEDSYYIVYKDNTGDWSEPLKFTHSGNDVYEDPNFTLLMPAAYAVDKTTRIEQIFKIVPESAKESLDETLLLGSDQGDGDVRMEAAMVVGGGTFSQPSSDEAKMYSVSLNMLKYSISIEALKFDEFIYVPGDHQSWQTQTAPALRSPGFDGVYTGFSYLKTNGFKFTKQRNAWDPQYNATVFTTLPYGFTDGGGNDHNIIPNVNDFYYIEANITKATLKATKVTWSMVGAATGGWPTDDSDKSKDVAMAYDDNDESWTAKGIDMTAGEFKFRANNAWELALGGSMNDLTTVGGAGNLSVTEAGKYDVKLYLTRSSSTEMYCTLTKVE